FTLDADSVRARLLALPWVATASVTTDLPNTVRIAVTEQTPILRLRGGGRDVLLAADGAMLPLPGRSGLSLQAPVLLDDRIGSSGPIDPALLQALDAVKQQFQTVLGCGVAAFQWGTDGVFAAWSTTGWRAV